MFRNGRPFYDADLPLAELAAAQFPKLVLSGGHSEGFECSPSSGAERAQGAQTLRSGMPNRKATATKAAPASVYPAAVAVASRGESPS